MFNLYALTTSTDTYIDSIVVNLIYTTDIKKTIPELKLPKGYIFTVSTPNTYGFSKNNLNVTNCSEIQSAIKSKKFNNLSIDLLVPLGYKGVISISPKIAKQIIIKTSGQELQLDKHKELKEFEDKLLTTEQCAIALSNVVISAGNSTKQLSIDNSNYCNFCIIAQKNLNIDISSSSKESLLDEPQKVKKNNKAAHYYFPEHNVNPGLLNIDCKNCLDNTILSSSRQVNIESPQGINLFSSILAGHNNSVATNTILSQDVQNSMKSFDRCMNDVIKQILSKFKEDVSKKGMSAILTSLLADVFYLNRIKLSTTIKSNRLLSNVLIEMANTILDIFGKKVAIELPSPQIIKRALRKIETTTSAYKHDHLIGKKRSYRFANASASDVSVLSSFSTHYSQAASDIFASTSKALKD